MWSWSVLGAAPVPPQPSFPSHGGQWEGKDRISWGCYDTRGIRVGSRDLFPLAEGFECA